MFGPLGIPEILFILAIALLIFGPRRLPEVGRTLGKAMGEFRKATTELKRSINTEIALEDEDERPKYSRAPRPPRQEAEGAPAGRRGDEIQVTTSGLLMPGAVARDAPPPADGEAGEPGERPWRRRPPRRHNPPR